MPTFEFRCTPCNQTFEEVQPMARQKRLTIDQLRREKKRTAKCPACGIVSSERIFSSSVYFVGAQVENAEYNPALGQVVKNSRHRKDLAKEKGLIEIGNEPPEKIHKKFESDRADKLKKSWEEV
jgi:predicted nucleic acid-binding Zn ribbon protein